MKMINTILEFLYAIWITQPCNTDPVMIYSLQEQSFIIWKSTQKYVILALERIDAYFVIVGENVIGLSPQWAYMPIASIPQWQCSTVFFSEPVKYHNAWE